MSIWDRKPRASKADGVRRQKFNYLDGSQYISRSTVWLKSSFRVEEASSPRISPTLIWRLLLCGYRNTLCCVVNNFISRACSASRTTTTDALSSEKQPREGAYSSRNVGLFLAMSII
jgi:hypothetical protein